MTSQGWSVDVSGDGGNLQFIKLNELNKCLLHQIRDLLWTWNIDIAEYYIWNKQNGSQHFAQREQNIVETLYIEFPQES